MKLIVEISDEKWQRVKDGTWCGSEEIAKGTPLEPCSDAISRQAAIDKIMGRKPDAHYPDYYAAIVRDLPSVHAEPHLSCDGCEYEHFKEFNERCKYCCRSKSDRYSAEMEADNA